MDAEDKGTGYSVDAGSRTSADDGTAWERAILHVDMDAFYASVEVLDDPSLAGRPVVVGGTPEGRGVVAAASYEARTYGIHSAMSAARARQLCPHAVFLRGRMARYAEVSRLIFAVFEDFTPLVEPLSIDEAFLDVSGCRRLLGAPADIGRRVKRRIRDEVGLTASVGVAPNKFLAKLASDLEKPDGFCVIAPGQARERLAPLPVGRLWGVGRVTAKAFADAGIATVADLLARPEDELVRRFGDRIRHLRQLAVGRDERPVIPAHEAKSVGNEITFSEDIADPLQLTAICDHLADKVARRLRAHGFVAGGVVLKARYRDFTTVTRSLTLPQATDAGVGLRDAARELLERRLDRRGRPLRLLGVTAVDLGRAAAAQGSLFPDPAAERDRNLDRVLDDVQARFGTQARFGPLLRRGAAPAPESTGHPNTAGGTPAPRPGETTGKPDLKGRPDPADDTNGTGA
jgi:DNA polymerase-4